MKSYFLLGFIIFISFSLTSFQFKDDSISVFELNSAFNHSFNKTKQRPIKLQKKDYENEVFLDSICFSTEILYRFHPIEVYNYGTIQCISYNELTLTNKVFSFIDSLRNCHCRRNKEFGLSFHLFSKSGDYFMQADNWIIHKFRECSVNDSTESYNENQLRLYLKCIKPNVLIKFIDTKCGYMGE